MGLIYHGTLGLRCKRCKREHTIASKDFDLKTYRGMKREIGFESHYELKYCFRCECNSKIDIQINTWEYPKGLQVGQVVYSLSWGILTRKLDIQFTSEE